MKTIEKIICYSFQEEGTCHAKGTGATQGSTEVSVRRQKERVNVGKSLYCCSWRNEWVKRSKQS